MKTMPYNLSGAGSNSISTAISTNGALTMLYDKNSIALESGKIVNSSYDNSTLYFKDMRLSERASGLNSVIDGLTNVVSLLDTTSKTIDGIADFLKQAKALANSSLDNKNYVSPIVGKNQKVERETSLSKLPHADPANDEIIIRTGDADKMESSITMTKETTLEDLGLTVGEKLNLKIGNDEWISLEITELDVKVSDFLGQVTEKVGADKFKVEFSEGKMNIQTLDRRPIVMEGSTAEAFGFDLSTTHIIKTQANWTVDNLITEIGKIKDLSATVNKEGFLEINALYGDDLVIADKTGKLAESFGINGVSDDSENKHQTYAERYNDVLKQIDDLVKDSSFNGLNLLEGDSIRAVFDENGSTFRTINGQKLDSTSLGLSPAKEDWQNDIDPKAVLEQIELAEERLKYATNKFDRASAMVQSRSDFMTSLSASFEKGAESLTGADLNEVSMEQLAINTQKQLINEVINLTLAASNSVLKLF